MKLAELNDWAKKNWLLLIVLALWIIMAIAVPQMIEHSVNECVQFYEERCPSLLMFN